MKKFLILCLVAAPGFAQQQPVDRQACEKARRDYEVAASSITMKKSEVEARKSLMYTACGLREPDKTNVNVRVNNSR